MWRVLRTRQAIGLIAFVIVIVPTFLLLSRWQLHRWDERKAYNAEIESGIAAAPTSIDRVLSPSQSIDALNPDLEYRVVTAVGRYDLAGQLLVRRKSFDTVNGFWVVTPLTTDSGSTLLVNRGWVPAGKDASSTPDVPAPAPGITTVTGRVRLSEDSQGPTPSDIPTGQVRALAIPDLLAQLGTRGFPAYIELTDSTPVPAAGVTLLPAPEITDGPHLSYAIQWIFFAVMAIGGLIYLLRLEVIRRRTTEIPSRDDTQMGDHAAS